MLRAYDKKVSGWRLLSRSGPKSDDFEGHIQEIEDYRQNHDRRNERPQRRRDSAPVSGTGVKPVIEGGRQKVRGEDRCQHEADRQHDSASDLIAGNLCHVLSHLLSPEGLRRFLPRACNKAL